MRKKIVTLALAGSLGLGGAVLLTPGLATAQTVTPSPSTGNAVTDRITALKDALKGLVQDRTLTQAQADRVASTLAQRFPGRGPGGHHGRHHGRHGGRVSHEAIAEVLGITVQELEEARMQGKTLAQIAQEEGVSRDRLVTGLVAAAKEQLAADVEAGRLTQAQADELSADLKTRITEKIDRVGGHGGRGHHHDGRDADADADADAEDTPSGSPSASTRSSGANA